jgi:Fe-S cluster assembly protein SufD
MADRGTGAGVRPVLNGSYAEAFERSLLGAPADGLTGKRREGFDRFATVGFPTTRQEDWRFTPVGAIAQHRWELNPDGPADRRTAGQLEAGVAPFRFGPAHWLTLVFVDGAFHPGLSHRTALPEGVLVEPLSEALERNPSLVEARFGAVAGPEVTPFVGLNAAFAREGVVIRVSPGVEIADPLHLLFVTTTQAADRVQQIRNLMVFERGARAQVVESYAGIGSAVSFTNTVTEVAVAADAWIEHTRIQRESESAFHIGLTSVHQEGHSHYRSFTLNAGASLARHDLQARLGGEEVETLLYGLYLGRNQQLVDNHTVIFHDHPNCRSWEVYKGILDDRSHAVFNGKVFVKPEAQKTDAKQTNRNLLLSDGAKVDTKPQLEIFADDVKCTHGATVGRIDEVAYYYLQSRGIPRAEAQRILTYAFAAEVVEEVASPPVRDALDRLVRDRMGVRG